MTQGGAGPAPWPGSAPSRTTGRPLSLSQPQEVAGQGPTGSSEPGRQPSTGVQPHATGQGCKWLLPPGSSPTPRAGATGRSSRPEEGGASRTSSTPGRHQETRNTRAANSGSPRSCILHPVFGWLTTELSQDGTPTAGSLSHPASPARPTGALPPSFRPAITQPGLLASAAWRFRSACPASPVGCGGFSQEHVTPTPRPASRGPKEESMPPPSQYRPQGAGGGFCSPPKSREPGAASRPGHPTLPEKPRPPRQAGHSPLLSVRAPLWAGLGVRGLPRGAGRPGGGLFPEGGT